MIQKRKYPCTKAEVPAIAVYLVGMVHRDLDDFVEISDTYDEDYLTTMLTKASQCNDLLSSDIITQEIKFITRDLKETSDEFRLKLNRLEFYLNSADGTMSAHADGMGLQLLRDRINKGTTESVVAAGRALLTNVNRNLIQLKAVGLKDALIDEITSRLDKIEKQSNAQNLDISSRNRNTDTNMVVFNELWEMNRKVLATGRALYRNVNAVKLKDYTLTAILQRISSGRKSNPKEEKPV